MTQETPPTVPSWLDPLSDTSGIAELPRVERSQIDMAGLRVLTEPLTAQRLVTASHNGLILMDDGQSQSLLLSKWGHSLPSAVAVLMPPPEAVTDATERRARRKYQERLLASQIQWPDLAARDTAFLLCADHKPPEYGLPSQLYREHRPDGLLPWDGIPSLLDQITKAVSPVLAPAWIHARSALNEALATIIAESFKNTHDHAREETNGSNVETSVRALYARYYSMSDVLHSIALVSPENITPVERYIRGFSPRSVKPGVRLPDQPSVNGFLELSVLDSGPGMAARWLNRPVQELSPKEQLAAILQCFGKGRTTTGAPGRGFGLWKVLLSLSVLRGFISVRTNNIHAYRQFGHLSKAGQEEMPGGGPLIPKEQLYDWRRELSTEPSAYPHVKGTVISFLLPMGQA